MSFPAAEKTRAAALLSAYRLAGWRISTAESCTGGLLAALLTEIAGSSDVVDCGFVTYSNEAKIGLLGVSEGLLQSHGAVSQEVARAMAAGALRGSRADVAVAITGIAGPGGGSREKPVGLVHLACEARRGGSRHLERRYGELGREAVREAALSDAIALLEDAVATRTQPPTPEAGSRP